MGLQQGIRRDSDGTELEHPEEAIDESRAIQQKENDALLASHAQRAKPVGHPV